MLSLADKTDSNNYYEIEDINGLSPKLTKNIRSLIKIERRSEISINPSKNELVATEHEVQEKLSEKWNENINDAFEEVDSEDDIENPENQDLHFTVENVIGERVNDLGKTEFLLKWEGYRKDESTWELESECECQDLIDKYRKRISSYEKKKSKKAKGKKH